jgi:hypothetical protein
LQGRRERRGGSGRGFAKHWTEDFTSNQRLGWDLSPEQRQKPIAIPIGSGVPKARKVRKSSARADQLMFLASGLLLHFFLSRIATTTRQALVSLASLPKVHGPSTTLGSSACVHSTSGRPRPSTVRFCQIRQPHVGAVLRVATIRCDKVAGAAVASAPKANVVLAAIRVLRDAAIPPYLSARETTCAPNMRSDNGDEQTQFETAMLLR